MASRNRRQDAETSARQVVFGLGRHSTTCLLITDYCLLILIALQACFILIHYIPSGILFIIRYRQT